MMVLGLAFILQSAALVWVVTQQKKIRKDTQELLNRKMHYKL